MTWWYRHAGDSRWHTGASNKSSFCTLCAGRWPLSDVTAGAVERSANPPLAERCDLCAQRRAAIDAERTEVHMLVDYLLMAQNDTDGCPPLMGEAVAKLAREVSRLRADLEERTNELHLAERELAEAQAPRKLSADAECARLEVALLEAVEIALRAGRRGFVTPVEHQRCGALMRLVPQ